MSLEKIILIGNVGKEANNPFDNNPEFTTISLATSRKWKNQQGEEQNKTVWYECVTQLATLAKILKMWVKKGDQVYIEGVPEYSIYQSKSGTSEVKVRVRISNITLLSNKKDSIQDTQIPNKPKDPYGAFMIDDDIPF